ncbi:substrate-binding periplasmic protein [Bdellovibrio sp. HCB337]|uniref:substrate-binding periplasmic protein n=1 Tax=Bdellovibrio sp. HCB337 TaxID=3394358 RepID=UPI0039A6A21D
MVRHLVFATVLFVVGSSSLATEKPLKRLTTAYFGVANETALPFIEVKNSEITRGILKDLAEAIFKEMKIKPVLVLLPKKRVAPDLISGNLSIVCYANEAWFPDVADQLLWSDPITTNSNLIVSLSKNRPKKIEDLYGKQIGTLVNYYYSKLDPYFEKNLMVRENASDNEGNLKKLIHGRIDYMVLSNLELHYYQKTYPLLEATNILEEAVKVKCVISKKSGIDMKTLNKAIETLRDNGTLEKIFRP